MIHCLGDLADAVDVGLVRAWTLAGRHTSVIVSHKPLFALASWNALVALLAHVVGQGHTTSPGALRPTSRVRLVGLALATCKTATSLLAPTVLNFCERHLK